MLKLNYIDLCFFFLKSKYHFWKKNKTKAKLLILPRPTKIKNASNRYFKPRWEYFKNYSFPLQFEPIKIGDYYFSSYGR